MSDRLESVLQSARDALGDNDWRFLCRVYRENDRTYVDRLRAIGFEGMDRVLDAGCGFGQWSMALAELNRQVVGSDICEQRVEWATRIAEVLDKKNVEFLPSTLTELSFDDASFDAVFCYGVLFLSDVRRALTEFRRVLRPGGRLYVNANGIGWYVHLWMNAPNQAADHDPRDTVVRAFTHTLEVRRGNASGTGHTILTPDELRDLLSEIGFGEIRIDAEGCLNVTSESSDPVVCRPFFRGEYQGLTGVFEALGRR